MFVAKETAAIPLFSQTSIAESRIAAFDAIKGIFLLP
jgi:hypothetical protein